MVGRIAAIVRVEEHRLLSLSHFSLCQVEKEENLAICWNI